MSGCKCFQPLRDVRQGSFLTSMLVDKISASHLSLLQRLGILTWAKTPALQALKTETWVLVDGGYTCRQ